MKSALEFYDKELRELDVQLQSDLISFSIYQVLRSDAFIKAQEMEEEQIINFAKTLPIKTRLLQEGGTTYMRGDVDLHYNQTFKQQEQ
jgi:hypothetical protein